MFGSSDRLLFGEGWDGWCCESLVVLSFGRGVLCINTPMSSGFLSLLGFPLVDISLHTRLLHFHQRRDTYRKTGAHGSSTILGLLNIISACALYIVFSARTLIDSPYHRSNHRGCLTPPAAAMNAMESASLTSPRELLTLRQVMGVRIFRRRSKDTT
jgi:hypothetical protein